MGANWNYLESPLRHKVILPAVAGSHWHSGFFDQPILPVYIKSSDLVAYESACFLQRCKKFRCFGFRAKFNPLSETSGIKFSRKIYNGVFYCYSRYNGAFPGTF